MPLANSENILIFRNLFTIWFLLCYDIKIRQRQSNWVPIAKDKRLLHKNEEKLVFLSDAIVELSLHKSSLSVIQTRKQTYKISAFLVCVASVLCLFSFFFFFYARVMGREQNKYEIGSLFCPHSRHLIFTHRIFRALKTLRKRLLRRLAHTKLKQSH